MRLSTKTFDPAQPWWSDYLPFIRRIEGTKITDCEQLNSLVPEGLKTEGGQRIRFVPSTELGDTPYEYRIYTSGRVSTRPDNWHDLFNALVWMRFPRIKVAMNALHYSAWPEQHDGRRGDVRDALTLFDECGVIVFSSSRELLQALAERRWMDAFLGDGFRTGVQVSICGHAILEKYLSPYKAMTAKALLVHTDADFQQLSREEMLTILDRKLAARMLAGTLLTKPACLTPLPLAGIPGWWPAAEQDRAFYLDLSVFRPPPANLATRPPIEL